MTREDIRHLCEHITDLYEQGYFDREQDALLAALAKEREGDKVLAEGELFSCIHEVYGRYYKEIGPESQRGQLIFRPAKGGE